MLEKVKLLEEEISTYQAADSGQLEQFRLKFISRKGVITDLFSELKNVPPDQRKEMGQVLNALKNAAQS
ncbi:MAG: phenylalanine--tRNA ligase subunit alpha, partial [Cyclobacteriaceae bacterium]